MSATPPPTSPASAAAPPASPAGGPAGSPSSSPGRPKGVDLAVFYMWNNQYAESKRILETKKGHNPRYALEFANLQCVQGLMSASNEQREAMLDVFQVADNLATASKYSPQSDSSSDEDEDLVDAAATDAAPMTEKEKAKARKIKEAAKEEARAKNKEAFKLALKVAAKSGAHLNQNWKLECDVIYADALLVRSLVQLTMNSYMKGAYNLRKTWGCYYALMQEVEKDAGRTISKELELNIKYGCGVFYTYLALVPAGLMKLLSAIGFISDRELGEQYLTEVLQSNAIRSPSAGLVLLTYYLFLPTGLGNVEVTLSKAKAILDLCNERYPNNTYFNGYSNFYHRKRGETREALETISKAIRFAEASGSGVPLLLKYLQADTLFMDLQWSQARETYHNVLEALEASGETFAYTGQVVLSLAGCYVMLGDEATAMTWLRRVGSMYNSKSKQDANSPKYADRVIREPRMLCMLPVYILYINRDLAHMHAEHVDHLVEHFQRVTRGKDLASHELKGMYNLFVGVMNKGCGRKVEAMTYFQQVFDTEAKMSADAMVLPYLYYEVGELEYRNNNLVKAKQLFEKGKDLKGDGHETLANRYSIAMKQLKREMQEKGMTA